MNGIYLHHHSSHMLTICRFWFPSQLISLHGAAQRSNSIFKLGPELTCDSFFQVSRVKTCSWYSPSTSRIDIKLLYKARREVIKWNKDEYHPSRCINTSYICVSCLISFRLGLWINGVRMKNYHYLHHYYCYFHHACDLKILKITYKAING